jgi:hypothetical protein
MTTDALARRVRSAPRDQRVGRLVLSEADYELFEAIDRHGPLPSNYLYEFTKDRRRDRTHHQNRLTEFYNGDRDGPYLARPRQQFASYSGRYQHLVYDLAPRARLALATRGTLSGTSRSDPFVHRLMTACVTASFELAAPKHGLRCIALSEILARPGCEAAHIQMPLTLASTVPMVIADGLFGLEYPGSGFRFFALEIDRNTESIERKNLRQSAFAHKVHGYAQALRDQRYRTWWGVPNLHILIVTTSAIHARNLIEFVRSHVDTTYLDRFAVSVAPSFGPDWRAPVTLMEELLGSPWQTAAGPKWLVRS